MAFPPVLENWSGTRLSESAPWTATREFNVAIDPASLYGLSRQQVDEIVLGTVVSRFPDTAVNQSWSSTFKSLKSEGPKIKDVKGPGYFIVEVNYHEPTVGVILDPTQDPLQRPEMIRWETVETSEQVDVDADARPLMNAAGDMLDPMSRPITLVRFTLTRYEPAFDISKAVTYSNTVNDKDMTIFGGFPVKAEHMRCVTIQPADELPLTKADYVRVAYTFEAYLVPNLPTKYPFQYRAFNQGSQGWGTFTRSGSSVVEKHKFGWNANSPVDAPIPLDLDGTPATGSPFSSDYANIRVVDDTGSIVSPAGTPTQIDFYKTELLGSSPARGYAIYFKRFPTADHSALKL